MTKYSSSIERFGPRYGSGKLRHTASVSVELYTVRARVRMRVTPGRLQKVHVNYSHCDGIGCQIENCCCVFKILTLL